MRLREPAAFQFSAFVACKSHPGSGSCQLLAMTCCVTLSGSGGATATTWSQLSRLLLCSDFQTRSAHPQCHHAKRLCLHRSEPAQPYKEAAQGRPQALKPARLQEGGRLAGLLGACRRARQSLLGGNPADPPCQTAGLTGPYPGHGLVPLKEAQQHCSTASPLWQQQDSPSALPPWLTTWHRLASQRRRPMFHGVVTWIPIKGCSAVMPWTASCRIRNC